MRSLATHWRLSPMLSLTLALVVATVGTIGFATTRASADYTVSDLGVAPQYFVGNEDCSALITNPLVSDGAKWNTPPGSGTVYIGSTGVVNFVFTEPAGAGAGQGTHMDWDSNIGIDTVVLKAGNGFHAYNYTSFLNEVYADGNLITPLKDDGSHYEISHVSFCLDRDVEVSKTADPSYTTTWDWDVEKSVSPAQLDLFDGQSGDVNWTIDVINNGSIDTDHAVEGTITIHNPWTEGASIDSVDDVLDASGAVSVDCGVTFPYLLAGGGTLECTYSSAASVSDSLNTVSVEISAGSEVLGGSATADVDWGAADVTTANETVTLDDPRLGIDGQLIPNAGATLVVSETLTCDEDEGTQTNVASISTGDSDDASVIVNCYDVSVSKTAETSYTRTHDWSIDKSVDQPAPFVGEEVNYTIDVAYDGSVDSAHAVGGVINITNNHPSQVANVVLNDALSSGETPIVNQAVAVPAGGSVDVNYSQALAGSASGTNTAIASLFGIDYSGSAGYSFDLASPTVEIDATVLASDPTLGLSQSFTQPNGGSFGGSATYGAVGTYSNTATVVEDSTNDAGDPDENTDTVIVKVYDIAVSKTALTSLTRTHDWSVVKTVDEDEPFAGEQVTYTVTTNYDGAVDSAHNVAGVITVTNNHPTRAASGVVLNDALVGIADEDLADIPVGSSAITAYSADLDGTNTTNTATATLNGVDYDSNTVPVLFGDDANTINHVDQNVTTADADFPAAGNYSAPAGGSFQINATYFGTGEFDNTACVAEASTGDAGDPDENCSTAVVNVYDISVSKTADSSLTRTHDWHVEKSVDQDAPFVGENITYTIDVLYDGYVDSDHAISGAVTVTNNHPNRDADGVTVVDTLGGVSTTVDVPAGGSTPINYGPASVSEGTTQNVATATLFGKDYTGTAPVNLSGTADSITEIDASVTASDLGSSVTATAPTNASFNVTVSYGSTGSFTNSVSIDEDSLDDPGDPNENDDSVTVNVYDISVSKTANSSLTRTHDWHVEKSVDQDAPFVGENITYTIDVLYDGFVDSDHAISGAITVTNNHPTREAEGVTVVDTLGGVSTTVNVPAGGSTPTNYGPALVSEGTTENVATATLFGKDYTGTAPVNLSGTADSITEIDASVTASDLGSSVTATAPTNASFDVTTSYDTAGAYDNTACVGENSMDDLGDPNENCDTVTVNVYDIDVSKTAAGTFTRTYDWSINKVATKLDGEGNPVPAHEINMTAGGAGAIVSYEIEVSASSADSAYSVAGDVTVINNHPNRSASVTVVDSLSTGENQLLGAMTIGPAGSETVSYNFNNLTTVATGDSGVNTAVATINGIEFDADAGYSFDVSDASLVNELADVTDNYDGDLGAQFIGNFGIQTLTLTGQDSFTTSYEYDVLFTHDFSCDTVVVPNFASVLFGGGSATSDWNVTVSEFCGFEGTRTPGYWKTHNDTHQGGARTDETWYELGDLDGDGVEEFENEDFYDSGLTWFEVLSQPDGGDPWNTLARHYAAAYMNVLAGTDITDLQDVTLNDGTTISGNLMDFAEALLIDFTGIGVVNNLGINPDTDELFSDFSDDGDPWTRTELRDLGIKGKVVSQYLNSFAILLNVAEYLDAYNNGYAYGDDPQVGPGHADG